MSTLFVKVKEMFSFQQDLSAETLLLIANSCQKLKKLNLEGVEHEDDVIIKIIDKIGKQLTSLVLDGSSLTDNMYSYLHNCAR